MFNIDTVPDCGDIHKLYQQLDSAEILSVPTNNVI